MKQVIIKLTWVLALYILSITHSFAAVFCVSTSAEFQNALDSAAANVEANQIKLKSGNYPVPSGSPFIFLAGTNDTQDLKISGGWSDFGIGSCNFRGLNTSAFDTELDGQSQHDILRIYPNNGADVIISELAFINGNNNSGNASGLIIASNGTLNDTVVVENNVFLGNEAEFSSALLIQGGMKIIVRNNFLIANHSINFGAISLVNSDNRGIYFTNNTVLANTTDGISTVDSAAVYMSTLGSSKSFIANNILWNNDIGDLYFNGNSYFYHNDVGSYTTADPPIDSAGNFSAEPGFESAGPGGLSFTPAYNSNLYNQGIEPPIFTPVDPPFESDWDVGVNDTFGRDRVVNGRVDIGSFETPQETPIFEHGFEAI